MIWLLACTSSAPDTGDSQGGDTQVWDTDVTPAEGVFCDPAEQIGSAVIQRWGSTGSPSLYGRIWDQPDPWIDQPTLAQDPCAFYEWTGCEDCPERRALEATTTVNGQEFASDPETGLMWGELTGDAFELSVTWSGGTATAQTLTMLDGLVPTVSAQGDYDQPGDLTVTWTGADSGHVATWIPINHHANPYTWTECMVDASEGAFTVPGDMVNPLSVSTGLEFQGVWHGEYMAAETDAGCIQFAVQTQHHTDVQFN